MGIIRAKEMNQNKGQVELKVRNTFSKRERLKVGKEGERERESWGRGIERKIKRKKYTHRIETYRSKD